MKFLYIQKLCFHALGFQFKPNDSFFARFYTLLSWSLLAGVTITEAHFVLENITDIKLVTDTLCTWLTSILTLIKVMRMISNRSKFYKMVNELDDMWLKVSSEDKFILEKALETDNRLTLIYFVSGISAGLGYLITPIAKAVFEIKTTGNATWTLPYRSVFVYDATVSPNYELSFLWFCQISFVKVFGSIAVDCMFYGSSYNIGSHFKVVQKKMQNFDYKRISILPGKTTCLDIFLQLIEYHQKLFIKCKELSELYAPIIFIQFLITAVQICVIAYQITLPGQFAGEIASKIFFLVTICFQCFMYCDAGSELITESFGVSSAMYASSWYESPIQVKRMIHFVLLRAQKSFVIYSGFYVADLITLSNIIKAAGSYVAILQSLQD